MSRLLNQAEAVEFKKTIDNYELHESVIGKFKSSNFAVIAGPAGAGKDTLRNSLIDKAPDKYQPVLSTTTRPMRKGEKDGDTYHFVEIESMRRMLENQEFFQAALVHNQQVSCLHVDEINKLGSGQYGLSILVVQTEKQLKQMHPNMKTIFLTPPGYETMTERLRADRVLGEDEIKRRLKSAIAEIEYALESPDYYCIVSDTVDDVTKAADNFLENNIVDKDADKQARKTMQGLIGEIYNHV